MDCESLFVWVTHLLDTWFKFLLPSTWVVLRPVVCTSTRFLWTVRKPLSRHCDRRYWLLISEHWPWVSPGVVITFCLLLSPLMATSEPLLPVAGDCGAPDNVRGWHGPIVSRHSTKAARTLNLKMVGWKISQEERISESLAGSKYCPRDWFKIYWIHKKNLSEQGWHGHCSHLSPRPV